MAENDQRWITLNFQGKPIRKFDDGEFVCYDSRDLSDIMHIVNMRTSTRNFASDHKVSRDERNRYSITTYKLNRMKNVEDKSVILLKPEGVKRLITQSRSLHAPALAKFFNIDVYDAKFCAKETTCINQIISALSTNFECKFQFVVPDTNYRIDLYLPEIGTAIECDEWGHSDRDPSYEQLREQEIKNKLNCTFIRFNPDSPNFNIFDFIGRIYKAILT